MATTPQDKRRAGPFGNMIQRAARFASQIGAWAKFVGASAVIAVVGAASWWIHAVSLAGPSVVFADQVGFTSGPTVQVDASHLVVLKSYLSIYLHTKAFDANGNTLTSAPADAARRLGFLVHYQFVPSDFGVVEVQYYFAEKTPAGGADLQRLLREETPVLVDDVTALKGRPWAEYFFVEKPKNVTPGESIYLVFYQLGNVTAAGQDKHLLSAVSYPIDGSGQYPTWLQNRTAQS